MAGWQRLNELAVRLLRLAGSGAADLLWPRRCILCRAFLADPGRPHLCRDCADGLDPILPPRCPRCGLPLPASPMGDHLCGSCLTDTWLFNKGRSLFSYNQALAGLIHRGKFGGDSGIFVSLAACARRQDLDDVAAAELILPVPLHVSRLRQRGFNQSLAFARALFPGRRREIKTDLLLRPAAGRAQRGLKGTERRQNIRGAFSVSRSEAVSGRRVLVVDDVFTTGATINECARVLLRAGAAEVWFFSLARVL